MSDRNLIDGSIDRMEEVVKKGALKVRRKKLKPRVLKDVHDMIPDYERERSCATARKTAHSPVADMKRDVSNLVRRELGINNKKEVMG